MNEQEQIRAIAVLDGWTMIKPCTCAIRDNGVRPVSLTEEHIPLYLTSRDAIVPVIENLFGRGRDHKLDFLGWLEQVAPKGEGMTIFEMCFATPMQLCEALLRATGKWKE